MIAEIVFPIAVEGVFDYIIPEKYRKNIKIGMSVKVPFRSRSIWGLVVRIKEKSLLETAKLKEIETLKISNSEYIIKFYQWISDYYHCPFSRVLKPILNKNITNKKEKEISFYYHNSERYTAEEIKNELNLSDYKLRKMIKNGEIIQKKEGVYREAGVSDCRGAPACAPITLSQEQQNAVDTILNSDNSKPFLLFGITGSGKTHIYIEVAKKVLSEGKAVIILVPEISLTPQTISRFEKAMGASAAVMHSRMSLGERYDAIESVSSGSRKLLIGVRSAILVPMDNVGLIVVDEEHDNSYKQTDPEPRYNARDTAIVRAKLQNAKIILGSATPSFESFFNAQNGKYLRINLENRHTNAELPQVKIVNMLGKKTIFSDELREKMRECLDEKKQIILFLNRRGYSVNLICGNCGEVKFCPNCSVSLVYHRNGDVLKCHLCGYAENPNYKCGVCGKETIKYEGAGIQKIEDELGLLFPQAKILRMDADTTGTKRGHANIIADFAAKKADILLGTQMVAKGLDFANVQLVGVLQADIGLAIPDFRASEKMFQLLTQVAGRAGRAESGGSVIIQTFSPEEPSIIFAQKHDFLGYYENSINERNKLNYPPFVKIAKIKITGKNEETAQDFAQKITEFLKKSGSPTAVAEILVYSPVQSAIYKVESKFNFVIMLKSKSHKAIGEAIIRLKKSIPNVSDSASFYKVDIDPMNLW